MFRWSVRQYSLSSCLSDHFLLFDTHSGCRPDLFISFAESNIYSAIILFFGLYSLYLGIVWYRGVTTALLRVHQINL
jgi:hypothetical protein